MSVCAHRENENWLVMLENVERVSAQLSFSQDVSKSDTLVILYRVKPCLTPVLHFPCDS